MITVTAGGTFSGVRDILKERTRIESMRRRDKHGEIGTDCSITKEISEIRVSSFFFSSRRRHTRCSRDWSSDVCSSDLPLLSRGSHRRSLCPGQAVRIRIRRSERSGPRVRLLHANSTPFSAAPAQGRTECLYPAAGDRKSTRLNSSHGYISYAVFCLKKKKTPD